MSTFTVGQLVELKNKREFPNYQMIVTGVDDDGETFSGVCVSLSTGTAIPGMYVGKHSENNLLVRLWCDITIPIILDVEKSAFAVGDVVQGAYNSKKYGIVMSITPESRIKEVVVLRGDEAGVIVTYPLPVSWGHAEDALTIYPEKPAHKVGDLMTKLGMSVIITDVNSFLCSFTGVVVDSPTKRGLGEMRHNQPIVDYLHTPQGAE